MTWSLAHLWLVGGVLALSTSYYCVNSLPVSLPNTPGSDNKHAIQNIEEIVSNNYRGEESIFFEGDIRLKSGEDPYNILKLNYNDVRSKRETNEMGSGGFTETELHEDDEANGNLWPGGKIFFKFDGTLNPMYREVYTIAMNKWTNATNSCITFHSAEEGVHPDFILFKQDEQNGANDDKYGCYSNVGRVGLQQELSMSSQCLSVGHAAHEIGHAIGLWHEHSRSDRGKYIEILTDNIIETKLQNFGIIDTISTDVSYDIGSLMHYGPLSFAKVQKGRDDPTIRVKDDAPWESCDDVSSMGQREEISFKDSLRVQLMYGCGEVAEAEKPIGCKQSATPTPTPTPTPTTQTATPVATIPTPTRKRLRSNDIITLQMGKGSYGVRCVPSPGCTPTPCTDIFGFASSRCSQVDNQFKLINPFSSVILSGDTVVLRSVHKPSTWLNCSGPDKECTITQCTSNAADPSNSSYISNCEEHYFIIDGVNRRTGKVLSTKHSIKFKLPNSNSYLNCLGKRCQMLEESSCPNLVPNSRQKLVEKISKDVCKPQSFRIDILF